MSFDELIQQPLAMFDGPKCVNVSPGDQEAMFHWPIVTEEDEQAVLEVLRAGTMSGLGITEQFEEEFKQWQGTEFALATCNGTAGLLQAMFGVKLGRGDEMLCPSITYWASAMQVMSLGATPVFVDIDPDTLCIDPADIERHITPRTKAIMVVHYCGHPCDMDAIMPIAKKHNIKVIEDVSHAQGSLYKGRKVGTFGDVAAMSMMGGKSFAIGEGGMIATNDREIFERTVAFGHYARHGKFLTLDYLKAGAGLPLGGMKGRLNQTCSAMGRVQLKHYDARCKNIQAALNRFWDLLDGTPGLQAHRPDPNKYPDSTMGGWYNPLGLYNAEELGGLSPDRFFEALAAENGRGGRGGNFPLHRHAVMNDIDIYNDGKPTRIACADRDVRQPEGSLPVSEKFLTRAFGVPYFKHDRPELIEQYAAAFKKVALNADKLLETANA